MSVTLPSEPYFCFQMPARKEPSVGLPSRRWHVSVSYAQNRNAATNHVYAKER